MKMNGKSEGDTRKIKVVGYTRPSKCQSTMIYDPEGLARTLCSADYKAPLKIIEKYFTEFDEGRFVTMEREREAVYAITTRPRTTPLSKRQDNYVMEMTDKTLKLRETTKKGYKEAKEGDGVELSRSHCSVRRGVSHDDSTGALNTQEGSWGTVTNDFRIRKLTPKECERLQAFPDDWTKYGKDDELISDTQRYKCCGNAVTTSVITAIVDEMFDGVNDDD